MLATIHRQGELTEIGFNMRNFTQHPLTQDHCTQDHRQTLPKTGFAQLLEMALFEDTQMVGDLTCLALVPESAQGAAAVIARTKGVLAGMPLVPQILSAVDADLVWEAVLEDSAELTHGTAVGTICGPARGLLRAERLVLNFLGRLSGVATLTKRYVDAVQGTKAQIYDTRKTTPGWRLLEKYAVRCGSGNNHRTGLYDAVLIKDNHLAWGQQGTPRRQGNESFCPAEAVIRAREYLRQRGYTELPVIEIEVDTLEQLREVLPTEPDIVLLDNMSPAQIVEALQLRNSVKPNVLLEASGGITLETVRHVAETGVERISVGALTHAAVSLDFGLDWRT